MAMFHCNIKLISRSSGRTMVASSAYRNAEKLTDERTGVVHNYEKKKGVVAKSCFMFDGDKKIELDKSEVWNKAEKAEKAKNSRVGREYIVNLPHELNDDQREKLVTEFSELIAKRYGVAVDFAIHRPNPDGDERNHHAHILTTTRKAQFNKFGKFDLGAKTDFELSDSDLRKKGALTGSQQVESCRKEWEDLANRHLKEAKFDIRIDRRSYERQGISKLPTKKMGWKANQIERANKHKSPDQRVATRTGTHNRLVKEANAIGWTGTLDSYIGKKIKDLDFQIYVERGKYSAQQKYSQMPRPTPQYGKPLPPKDKDKDKKLTLEERRQLFNEQQERKQSALSSVDERRKQFNERAEANRQAEVNKQADQLKQPKPQSQVKPAEPSRPAPKPPSLKR